MNAFAAIDPHTLGLFDIEPSAPPQKAAMGSLRISRHADCMAALRHPSVDTVDIASEVALLQKRRAVTLPSLASVLGGTLIARRTPFHPAGREFMRSMQSKPAPQAVQDEIIATALARATPGEPVDLVPILNAIPLLLLVHDIGIAEETLHRWEALLQLMMVTWANAPDGATLRFLEEKAEEAQSLFREELEIARRAGSGRFFEAFTRGQDELGLAESDMCSLAMFLIVASVETTGGFLGSLALLLQRLPGFAERVRAEPAPRLLLLEEALRFLGPVRRLGRRVALEDVEIGGVPIAAGTALVIDIEAAHHDPLVYPDPWRFDPSRRGIGTFAFSVGAHTCVGSKIARQLSGRVLEALSAFDIAPAVETPPGWTPHPGFRLPSALPSVLTPH